MADVKPLLKEARKLLDEEKYKEAQECCKSILRIDKENYLGLILLGKSFKDSDQAPLAYQKAIASKPDLPLAWQGLANYYERKNELDKKSKLYSIYNELLKLQIDDEKVQEIITKLSQLGNTFKSGEAISPLINYIKNKHNVKLCQIAGKELIELLKVGVPCKPEDIPSILNYLDDIIKNGPNDSVQIYYGKVCMQKSDFCSAAKEVTNLDFFPSNVVLREWFCKFLCYKYIEADTFYGFDIKSSFEKIVEGIENSKYPSLLKSIIFYDESLYLEAYKLCVPLINYQHVDVAEATYILNCTIKLKKWSITQKLVLNFITKCKDENFLSNLRKYQFISLAKQKKWEEAISVARHICKETFNTSDLAMLTECYIQTNENADEIMRSLESTNYFVPLNALKLLKQQKYNEVIQLLEINNHTDTLSLLYLAKAYWGLQDYDNCHINLMKAAKLNTENAETFLYLGHIYKVRQDLEKAKKCYEKAYSYNNTDSEITKNLSDVYCDLGLHSDNFELLSNSVENIHDTWVYFRLGLNYLKRREWEKAIISFRSVIKSDHNSVIAYECLADAYYSRGSFMSALKLYSKVMVLNPTKASYCLTKIGYTYFLLGQHAEAIASFEKVFEIDQFSVLALTGIAEAWIGNSKKKESSKLFGSARDCAQNAINYITKALSQYKHILHFWKLLADTLMFITYLPNKYSYVYLNSSFSNLDGDTIKMKRSEIFPQAIAYYSYLKKQKNHTESYDLASAYLAYYLDSRNLSHCNVAYSIAINNLKSKKSNSKNWNLIGKICFLVHKYSHAQHCFIKGLLETEQWSEKVWCNLGILYLKLKVHKLANYCFLRGQSTLPSYPKNWIGQGLIAEELRGEEAMDLYRHASGLRYHPECALGYADWVCRTLQNNYESKESKYAIEGLYAIQHAIDLLEWYCCFEPNNASACTMLGILQERIGLIRASYKSYERALLHVEEDRRNIALLNMGRISVRMENYDEAIKSYKSITEASLNSTCGLALALYKKGLYEESYSAYDTALHWLSNDDNEKADLLVAMAGIVYMFKGPDDSKTLLFHSIQVSQKQPTVHSLFAICSLGLMHSDQSLSKLALSELQKYKNDANFGFDIGFLKSYLNLHEGNMEQAIKILCISLHDHPGNPLLWFNLAQYCLMTNLNKVRAKAASCCAQKALNSVNYDDITCNPAKILATASIAEYMLGNYKNATCLAKKGIHMFVDQADIWAALLFALLSSPDVIWTKRKEWILSTAGNMRRRLDISRPLSRWVGVIEKKISK